MHIKRLEISYHNEPLHIEYFLREGKKEILLYLHGLGCSKKDFIEAASFDELNDYTLVAFDFPGCGNSPYPENASLGMDDLTGITRIIISELSLNKLVIIGHSMGGLVALLYIKKYGEGVKAFISIEGNLAPEDCIFSREVKRCSLREFTEKELPEFKKKLSRSKNIGFIRYAETLELYSSPKAYFDFSPSLVHYSDHGDLIQLFNDLNIPKFFIYGSENKKLSYIPDLKCEVAEIPNSNHFPFYDNPEEFYRTVAGFLKKI